MSRRIGISPALKSPLLPASVARMRKKVADLPYAGAARDRHGDLAGAVALERLEQRQQEPSPDRQRQTGEDRGDQAARGSLAMLPMPTEELLRRRTSLGGRAWRPT